MESVVFLNLTSGQSYQLDELKNGDLTLGRGALLEITDSRVSRSHAVLKLNESKLQIKPVSKNPLFFYEKTEENGMFKRRVLPKDVFLDLRNGDRVSFLPDSLIFEVSYPSDSSGITETLDAPLSEPENNELEAPKQDKIEVIVPDSLESGKDLSNGCSSELSPEKIVNVSPGIEDESANKENSLNSSTSSRKRTLPNWMASQSVSPKTPNRATIPARNRGVNASFAPPPSSNLATVSSNTNGRMSNANVEFSPDLMSSTRLSEALPKLADSSNPLRTSATPERACTIDSEVNGTGNDSVDDVSAASVEQSKSETADASRVIRSKCAYGRSCYRKNPAHKREYAHSGDSDFSEEEEEQREESHASTSASATSVNPLDISKPQCPYGTKCYRRNAAHRANYRHDADEDSDGGSGKEGKKGRTGNRRERKIRSEQEIDDLIDQTYDYGDSFINDGSDLEEEEDWSSDDEEILSDPSDLYSEESEDNDRPSTSTRSSSGRKTKKKQKENGKKNGNGRRRVMIDSSDNEDSQEDLNLLIRESKDIINNDKMLRPVKSKFLSR